MAGFRLDWRGEGVECRSKEAPLFGLRGQELIIILVVVLLLFGARKLPELARSLGASAKEFRKGIEERSKGDVEDTDEP